MKLCISRNCGTLDLVTMEKWVQTDLNYYVKIRDLF